MALPPSLLKEVIDLLPETWVMKSESISNYLKKRGIKSEELEFSGIEKQLTALSGERIKKADLQAIESKREDQFGEYFIADQVVEYSDITLPGTNIKGYQEHVYTFKNKLADIKQISPHFDDIANYQTHTRVSQGQIGNLNSHIVQEIQSDLHQQARITGYTEKELQKNYASIKAKRKKHIYFGTSFPKAIEAAEIAKSKGDIELSRQYTEYIDLFNKEIQIEEFIESPLKLPGKTPFKDNWLRKSLEVELITAQNTTQDALVVPLIGKGLDVLKRSTGTDKWYATTVRSTLKKLAKEIGGEYKEVIQAEVTYGQIILPKGKDLSKQFKLYGAGSATTGMSQFFEDNDLFEVQ